MKFWLTASTIALLLTLSAAVWAACGVGPPQAPCAPVNFDPANPGGSGYVKVFEDLFTNNSNVDFNPTGSQNASKHWFTQKFFGGGNEPANTFTFTPTGMTIASTLSFDTGNYNLATATPANNPQGWVGNAFGGGAFFEAGISFNVNNVISSNFAGWPSFWSLATEWAAQKGADPFPGQASNWHQYVEDDFFELLNSGDPTHVWGTGIHHWFGPFGGPCPYGYKINQPNLCDAINLNNAGSDYNNAFVRQQSGAVVDWSTVRKIQHLWVPGTAANSNKGYVQNWMDNLPAQGGAGSGAFAPLAKTGWTDGAYTYPATFPGNAGSRNFVFSILDQQHLVVILGDGPSTGNHQYKVNFVRVWQIPGCGTIVH